MAEHQTATAWTNWGRCVDAHPVRTAHPTSTAEVVQIVRDAVETGLTVKAVGASHSFTAIAATDGVQITLDRMASIVATDTDLGRVRVQAGISLRDHSVRVRDGHTGMREPGTIGFAALRGGNVIGDHMVILAGASERIELNHRAQDRTIYANGAMRAVRWAVSQKRGLYAMTDVLGL